MNPPPLNPDPAPQAYVLVGPTASGKTTVANRLARAAGAGVVSADSMLIYRGLDIGTAKPSAEERAGIPYAGMDFLTPDRTGSVAEYLDQVRARLAQPGPPGGWIIAGGTGLYVKCLMFGVDDRPAENAAVRAEAERTLAASGVEGLRALVAARAPSALARLKDPGNPRRLIRALETGDAAAPVRRWSSGAGTRIAGLRPAPELLQRRIAGRVRRMYADGLLDEAAGLRRDWGALSATATQAIGYREAFAVLDGTMTAAEAVERTIIRTRQYAKRQMTWFRHQADVEWIDIGAATSDDEVARRVREAWDRYGRTTLDF